MPLTMEEVKQEILNAEEDIQGTEKTLKEQKDYKLKLVATLVALEKEQPADKVIPETMPYTLEDILKCKDIEFEDVDKDYKALCKFDAETNPRKFCGNKTIYEYQFAQLLECRRDSKNYKTIQEWFEDPQLKEKLWKDSIHRNRRDKAPYPSPTDVYECHRVNTGAIVPFKASTAKYLYKKFKATSVLDPTMGWGGRMLGATSLGLRYTGFDTNIDLKNGYEEMIGDLMLPNVKLFWETSLNEDIIKTLEYDMVLTSPPYENLELYKHMTPWDTEEQFYKDFLIPLMKLCNKYLHEDGFNCWNMSPKMYKKLTEKYGFPYCHSQEDLRQQLGKQFKTKSQDYTYVWLKMGTIWGYFAEE